MRHLPQTAALIAAAVLLAACSGGGSTSTSTAPENGTAAAGTPHYGGTFKIGSTSAADTLLPIYADVEGAGNDLPLAYDTLVNVDPQMRVIPWLAEKWDVSKDGLTYTMHLRHNATWSDGQPVTSADVMYEYALEMDPKSQAVYKSDYDVIANLKAPDKWTVVYTLKTANAAFLANVLSSVQHAPLPAHIYAKLPHDSMRHLDISKSFVGDGPYIVTEFKQDDHMTLTSNKTWWNGRPYIDEVYIKEYQTEQAQLIALQDGEVDMPYILTGAQWQGVKNDNRFTHIHTYANAFDWEIPNLNDPIMGDVNVRRAMMYAWDRKTEAAKLFQGEDIPVFGPISLAQSWAFDPAAKTAFPYDPAKAGQILDADGWRLGPDGVRYKNAQPLAITVGLISGNEAGAKDFEFAQAEMKAVGIKLTSKQSEINVFYQNERDGKFQLDSGGESLSTDPDPTLILGSSGIPPNGLNYARYNSPQMDALLKAALETTDQEKRRALYTKVQELAIQDVPYLWTLAPYYRNVVNARVKGVDPAQAGPFFSYTIFNLPKWWIAQ
jgi:peptide/nickel transport system substrate-binding protein